ncbi:hypothetical protein C8A05DRAFT_19414 [Staphylotrichum tortipilum]|uniref:Rhodopsin domain-containing protein n=1 Tax=Staphylotrichum tortipilum TaxID=2831512 RepID=A0AAN6MBY3_9PEZI|nr:hypothetical protein C8A05DRAFT_19414 [Staphylotrichum longicolle]
MDPTTTRTNLPRNDHESVATSLIVYSSIFLIVNIVVVALRFHVRLRVLRKFGNDDIALVITLGSTIAGIIGITAATRLGLGYHIDTLPMAERSTLFKLIFISSLGYHGTIMLLKATFLLQFRRVFPLPTFQLVCDIFLAFFAAWAVAGIIGGATICLPLNWDPRAPTWTCDKRLWFWMAHGVIHVVTDVLIFIMPLPLLNTLRLPPLHKMVLIGVFSLGFCTCVISAIRLTTLPASLRDPDISWTSATTVFWSVGEVTCSTVCLCIPTLRPLLGSWSFLGRIIGNENLMGQGTPDFDCYAISLPSSLGAPPTPSRTADAVMGNGGVV